MLVDALHAGIEERDELVDLSGRCAAAPEIRCHIHRFIKCCLRINAAFPEALIGGESRPLFNHISKIRDPIQRIERELSGQLLARFLRNVAVGAVIARLAAAHCEVFQIKRVRAVAFELVDIRSADLFEQLEAVRFFRIDHQRPEISRKVGEDRPDDIVSRDVGGHEVRHFSNRIDKPIHL